MTPLARLPHLEWCHRTAAGQHADLAWVDATLELHADTYRAVAGEDGVVRFQHFPYAAFTPPAMFEEAAAAQRRGEATLQEGLLLLFARVEWLIVSREQLWTSLTPAPYVLAALVEAYGVGPEVHGHHDEVLARLAALLPDWYPSRGTVAAARRVLACAEMERDAEHVYTIDDAGPTPPVLAGEVLVCRSLAFWAARVGDTGETVHRIENGVLLFQTPTPRFELRREDIVVAWSPGRHLSGELLRLLPPWTVLRPVVNAPPESP